MYKITKRGNNINTKYIFRGWKMLFIGIIAGKKCFENIKKEIKEKIKNEDINLVQINLRSIENVKNIKFETIIIEDNLEKFKKSEEILKKLLENTKYLIINTDKNPQQKEAEKIPNRITYGLNQDAIVTVSSITDTGILVYWQKNRKDREGQKIEIEERKIQKGEENTLKTYEILIIFALLKIYNSSIIEKI